MTHNRVLNIKSREVFWDDLLLEKNHAALCTFGQAEFHYEQPLKREIVLCLDKDWEGNTCGYFHYFYDGSQYRFYYRASNGFSDELVKKACICVLFSKDGIHWERPNLGLVEYQGSKNNNIVIRKDEMDNFFVFKDESPACSPAEQYKAVTQGPRTKEMPDGGLWAYFSPDGLCWNEGHRLVGFAGDCGGTSKEGFFDSLNTVHWDSDLARYRLYYRGFHMNKEKKVRDIRLALSDDFIHWKEQGSLHYCAVADNAVIPDEQLYTNGILPYYRTPHILTGFPVRYTERSWEPMFEQLPNFPWRREKMKRYGEPRLGTALTDGLFMHSRDGINFFRAKDTFLIPGIFTQSNWVYGDCFQGCGLLETLSEDGLQREISFFAGENYSSGPVGIRRYTIRLDGFACLKAGAGERQIITRPITFTGNILTLNMSTSGAGYIVTELLDDRGHPIPGYSAQAGYQIFGDNIALKVLFKRGEGAAIKVTSDISPLENKVVRLRFTLREAKLYAMQFVREEQ